MDLDTKLIDLLNKSIIDEQIFALLDLGANPNVLNKSGFSLLHLLVFNKRMNEVVAVIDKYKNINVNIKDKNGYSPLYHMLQDNHPVESIRTMLDLGADPRTKTQSGMAAIHLLIKDRFNYALELLAKHPENIHYSNAEGTPLVILLNLRHTRQVSADDYLTLVRLGAATNSKDKDGVSLLDVMMQLNQPKRTRELIALSKISPRERKHFTPELMDYFIAKKGMERLLDALLNNRLNQNEIRHLAQYPQAKECLIQYIQQLAPDLQQQTLKICITADTALNQFFSVTRDFFQTSWNRGSLKRLSQMHETLIKTRIESESALNPEHKRDIIII